MKSSAGVVKMGETEVLPNARLPDVGRILGGRGYQVGTHLGRISQLTIVKIQWAFISSSMLECCLIYSLGMWDVCCLTGKAYTCKFLVATGLPPRTQPLCVQRAGRKDWPNRGAFGTIACPRRYLIQRFRRFQGLRHDARGKRLCCLNERLLESGGTTERQF